MRSLFLAVLIVTVFVSSVSAGVEDFILANETGVDIAGIYVSPVAKSNWGEDILAADVLPNGDERLVKFHREEKANFWDLKIVDQEGTSLEWPELQLTEVSKVTLTIENGTPIATYE